MKISELQQPYRRMAEYLANQNCIQEASQGIYNFYKQGGVMDLFCNQIGKGEHPLITDKIKKNFPDDFDFSGEDGKNVNQNFRYISNTMLLDDILPLVFNKIGSLNSSEFNEWFNSDFLRFLFDKKHFIDKNNNELYTQLAKNGRFDELPDTCEFLEAVELEVWDEEIDREILEISGKYKGFYIFFDNEDDADELGVVICTYKHAQLPTPKIDFSEFKTGDVVEVESGVQKLIGYYSGEDENTVSFKMWSCGAEYPVTKKDIKSITKIK